MYIHDTELSASPTGSTNTLTQFCVHYSIPGTNIMPNVYMVRVRENVIAADVENDKYLYASETTITVTNSSRRRSTSRTLLSIYESYYTKVKTKEEAKKKNWGAAGQLTAD